MVVKTECEGGGVVSLYVGAANARRYFPKTCTSVELHLGDLSITCKLASDFWTDRPRICDPRLFSWLEYKVLHRCQRRLSVSLALVPSGTGAFRIEPLAVRPRNRGAASPFKLELVDSSIDMDILRVLGPDLRRVRSTFAPRSAVPLADDSLEALEQVAS
jgi:hypothetical protein